MKNITKNEMKAIRAMLLDGVAVILVWIGWFLGGFNGWATLTADMQAYMRTIPGLVSGAALEVCFILYMWRLWTGYYDSKE